MTTLKLVQNVQRGFHRCEFESRLFKAQKMMHERNIDAMLLTTEMNFHYFTGLNSQFWQSPTRPYFAVIPRSGYSPIVIIPEISFQAMNNNSWINNEYIYSFPFSSCNNDTAISILINILTKYIQKQFNNIAIPMGYETSLRMPLNDLFQLKSELNDVGMSIVDCTDIIREIRCIKSNDEINKIYKSCNIASKSFNDLSSISFDSSESDVSEIDIVNKMKHLLILHGSDSIPYIVGTSGLNGYKSIVDNPTSKILNHNDIMVIDTGSTFDGYFCDFNRNFIVNKSDINSRNYKLINNDSFLFANEWLYNCIEDALKVVVPGNKVSDLWYSMTNSLIKSSNNKIDNKSFKTSRFGHGLGLNLTEWPSITHNEDTILKSGMIMTIEPSINIIDNQILVHEENIVITDDGYIMLSERSPMYNTLNVN